MDKQHHTAYTFNLMCSFSMYILLDVVTPGRLMNNYTDLVTCAIKLMLTIDVGFPQRECNG